MTSTPSRASRVERPSIQFFCSQTDLPGRLAVEIQRSPYTSRPKYLNALIETVLTVPRMGSTSCFDTLIEWIQLFQSLPVERIRQLAPTQNRNFKQMVKHLLEIALTYYPENSSSASVTSEVWMSRAGLNHLKEREFNQSPERLNSSHNMRSFGS